MNNPDPTESRIPLAELAEHFAGTWTDRPPKTVSGVKIDSRTCVEGDLFVGLPGENTHGQQFVTGAASKGASAAIVEQEQDSSLPQWVVEDAERALGNLASRYRTDRVKEPVIGVTGSSGKTTTREMIAEAVRALGGKPGVTEGNRNNQLGLPLTILNEGHRTPLVAEVGINRTGEIDRLLEILQPTVGVLTTIGPSHIEGLESLQTVAGEKGKLLAEAAPGLALVPENVNQKSVLQALVPDLMEIYATPTKNGELKLVAEAEGEVRHRWIVPDPTLEPPFQQDALLALAVVGILGDDPAPAARRLADFQPMRGRGRVIESGKVKIIDGTYNANPQSTRQALERLSRMPGPRVAILGTMKELGPDAGRFHRELGEQLARRDIERIWFVGEHGDQVEAGAGIRSVRRVDTPEELPDVTEFKSGTVLVKASHSVGLHRWLADQVDSP